MLRAMRMSFVPLSIAALLSSLLEGVASLRLGDELSPPDSDGSLHRPAEPAKPATRTLRRWTTLDLGVAEDEKETPEGRFFTAMKTVSDLVSPLYEGEISDEELRNTYNLVLDTLWIEWGLWAAQEARKLKTSWDRISKTAFHIRNTVKRMVQDVTGDWSRHLIQMRQLFKYGDSHGPSWEMLTKKADAEKVFYSAFSSNGGDLGLASGLMKPMRRCAEWASEKWREWEGNQPRNSPLPICVAPEDVWHHATLGDYRMLLPNPRDRVVLTGDNPCTDFELRYCKDCMEGGRGGKLNCHSSETAYQSCPLPGRNEVLDLLDEAGQKFRRKHR
eukprot:TRINITY_DN74606_c0_g1_i1.p1 TRINITY_DN74606_c0_g1~~TRINITY_DN74606_c0_g1_i1.p1  ORF type:complete len:331 (+),score=33.23 TRINITY_DN74606_c0_g1_i1:68-1060(+)